MGGGGEPSTKRSKRSKNTRKKRNTPNDNAKERTLPKVDQMEKIPSNAPTMAIAPSDYEHIFHEGGTSPTVNETKPTIPTITNIPAIPTITTKPTLPPPQVQLPILQRSPPPQVQPLPQPPRPVRSPEVDYDRHAYAPDVQVTPDGYTMLGHVPEPSSRRRVALPPHIVRANNQFSRAALARLAAYLASRADR